MAVALTSWKRERLGLTMVSASLVAIGCIVVVLFGYLHDQRQSQIREQGAGLARLLSGMSYEQLVSGNGRYGMLAVLGRNQNNRDFAYAALVTPNGRPVAQVSAPGTIIPSLQLPAQPTSWLGEKNLVLNDRRAVQEFNAPVFTGDILNGYVRVGYFRPGYGLNSEQLAFFASLALPVFLLTPLFFLLLKWEIRPLKNINREIAQLTEQRDTKAVEMGKTGDLGQFVYRFNQFVDFAQQRITALESDRNGLVTSTKLLSYKRARVESVIQSFPDAVLVLDETGTITLANPAVATLLGVEPQDVIGTKPREWCTDDNVLTLLAGHESTGTGRYRSDPVEFNPRHSPEKILVVSAFPLFSPADHTQVLGTLIVFRDATAEHLVKQSRAEFVAHVAHELKSPLNVLAMYSEALQGEEGQSESFRIEAVNVIHDEIERFSSLISNILNITKIETGSLGVEWQRVKPREFLQDALDNASRNARGKELSVHLEAPKELNSIAADKALLSIAVNNLLTNAIKYSRPGGNVILAVEENDETFRIMVRDNGIGIAPEDREHIFDKFFRSNSDEVRQRTGHGLGLALAREIVRLHHGTLTVNSTLGEGSEFTIELPKKSDWVQQAKRA